MDIPTPMAPLGSNAAAIAAWEEHFGRALDLGWPVQKAAEIATQKTAHYRVK